jgi:hypothetical protein
MTTTKLRDIIRYLVLRDDMVTREANMVVGHALNSLLCVVALLGVHHC